MATNRTSPKKGKVVDIPTVPTIGTATAGAESASVAFTASTKGGPVSTYTALSNPGSVTGTGTSSPVTVTGLTAGTAYTFTVRGNNVTGSSEYSSTSNSVTPTVATAYESIATVTVGSGGQSTVTFSSIPSTYKHLQIRGIARSNRSAPFANVVAFQFNSDTTKANYWAYHALNGDGSSANAFSAAEQNTAGVWGGLSLSNNGLANSFAVFVTDILDYQNTNKFKTTRCLQGLDDNGGTWGEVKIVSGLWKSTAAINSITIADNTANNFMQYSQFAIYGIKG